MLIGQFAQHFHLTGETLGENYLFCILHLMIDVEGNSLWHSSSIIYDMYSCFIF